MKSFIFIDGPDAVGKTTLCHNLHESLSDILPTFKEVLPSVTGPLSFIRDTVTSADFKGSPLFRQCLHTMNQIEAFQRQSRNLSGYSNSCTVFDRGIASTFAYGKVCQLPDHELDLLLSVQMAVLKSLSDVTPLFITLHASPFQFRTPDSSYYEKLKLDGIELYYQQFSDYLWERHRIGSDVIDVHGKDPNQVLSGVMSILKRNNIV